jgi:two-component system cell cycle response regulator
VKILVAEDDQVSALILTRVLEKSGHSVEHATSGRHAWELAQSTSYDVIVSDWMMPEIEGLELCRLVRSQLGSPYTYFILLTAKSQREARMEALAAGVDDFLVKPLDREELQARLLAAKRILDMQDELRRHTAKLSVTMGYLETANRRFSDLFVGLPVASITFDTDGRIVEWNRASEVLYQREPKEVWQEPIASIITDREHRKWAEDFVARALRGETIENEETSFQRKDGSLRHVLYSTFPLRGSGGEILGAVCTCSDMTERRLLEQQLEEQLRLANKLNDSLAIKSRELAEANGRLEELATTDGLTGLKNHRYYNEILASQHSFAVRNKLPLSVILCDIDHFKQYNDSFGHPAGDQVLRQFAGILQENVRIEDTAARYGGEEFILLLPNCDQQTSLFIANKLRTLIESAHWQNRPVTASFGVATLGPSGPRLSRADLVDAADRALYVSKQNGRNRVSHAADVGGKAAGKTAA